MKKKLIIIVIVAILVSLGLSGCDQMSNPLTPDKNRFLGTWKVIKLNNSTTNGEVFTFFSDGTVSITGLSGTWGFKDEKLVMDFEDLFHWVYSYSFSNNDRTLTWIDMGNTNTLELTKQ